MTDQQRFFDQQLGTLLRPGEQVITRGVAEPSVAWVASILSLGLLSFLRRFYYMAITTQRVIMLKTKRGWQWSWTPYPGFKRVPKLSVDETTLLEWPQVAKVISRQSPAHMILGWRGAGFHTVEKKGYLFLVKRSHISFPEEQKVFYGTFFQKARETWTAITGNK